MFLPRERRSRLIEYGFVLALIALILIGNALLGAAGSLGAA